MLPTNFLQQCHTRVTCAELPEEFAERPLLWPADGCKKHQKYGDNSVIHWWKFWSVNTHTFYYRCAAAPGVDAPQQAVCQQLSREL